MANQTKNEATGSGLKRLLSQGGVYAVGNAIIKVSGIFLAPLYLNTTLLLPSAYAKLSLLEVTGQLFILLAGLGLNSALIKFSADSRYESEYDRIPFTAVATSAVGAFAVASLFLLFSPYLSRWLLNDSGEIATVRWYGLYVGLQAMLAIPYAHIRFRERARLYVVARTVEIAVLIGAVYFFLVHQHAGLRGIVYAFVLSSGLSLAILLTGLLSNIQIRFSKTIATRLLRYGAPLAIGGLAAPVLHAGDRYLIEWLMGSDELAIYYWGTRISGLLNMVFVQSISLAFSVVGIKVLSKVDTDISLHRRTFRHYSIWAGWCVLALSLMAFDLTQLLTSDARYPLASSLVLPLSLGFLFYGLYVIFVNAMLATGRTRMVATVVVAAAAINIVLNVFMIPKLGLVGAALSTTASYAFLAFFTAWNARKDFRIDYAWGVLTGVIGLVLVLSLLGTQTAAWSTPARLTARVGLLALYMPLVITLRLYRWEEVRQGVAMLKARWLS